MIYIYKYVVVTVSLSFAQIYKGYLRFYFDTYVKKIKCVLIKNNLYVYCLTFIHSDDKHIYVNMVLR